MLDELQRVQIALHDMLSQPDLKKINISNSVREIGEDVFLKQELVEELSIYDMEK